MTWKPLDSFSTSLKGKYIRFKSSHTEANLTNQMGISKKAPEQIQIPVGAIGLVYQVRGGTIFIGFGSNLRLPPPRGNANMSTLFTATITMVISKIDKLEVEG